MRSTVVLIVIGVTNLSPPGEPPPLDPTTLTTELGERSLHITVGNPPRTLVEGHALDIPGHFVLLVNLDKAGLSRFHLDPEGRTCTRCESRAVRSYESPPQMPRFESMEIRPEPVRADGVPFARLVRTPEDRVRIVLDVDYNGVIDVDTVTPFGWE